MLVQPEVERGRPPLVSIPLELPGADTGSVSRAVDIPSTPTYRRPDLRQVEHDLEKVFVFETEIQ